MGSNLLQKIPKFWHNLGRKRLDRSDHPDRRGPNQTPAIAAPSDPSLALTAIAASSPSRLSLSGWTVLVLAIALPISLPILFVGSQWLQPTGDVWQHLWETVLGRYLTNTAILAVGVSVGTGMIGVATAWLVVTCQFPGRRLWEWMLLLPMAIPAYLLAYTYTEFLEFYGPVQSGLRGWFGWEYGDYWFPAVRSPLGAILMLSLVLYPYVYLLCRVAFLEQSVCTLEASRVLGRSPWRSFWEVALPLARPAIATGLALVLMETLSDFGTVQFFGVDTFTTGIYRTWFGMGDRVAAAQLAAVLLGFSLLLLTLERYSRGRSRYYAAHCYRPFATYRLRGWRSGAAIGVCCLPLVLGFLLPAGLLLDLTIQNPETLWDDRFRLFASHSAILSSITALLGVILATLMAYGVRLQPSWLIRLGTRLASMGYAIPGSVVAIGVLVPLGITDNAIDAWMRQYLGISTGLLLSGTVAALVFAYLVRFLAISFGTVESSLGKIEPHLDDASHSLGATASRTLWRIHVPMMRSGLLTAAMLVFVDVMKELPATLIVRPFNFDTLAVRVYNLASDERLAEAAGPALAIVVVGLLPTLLLSWQITRSRPTSTGRRTATSHNCRP